MNESKRNIIKRSLIGALILTIGGLCLSFIKNEIASDETDNRNTGKNISEKYNVLNNDCSKLYYEFLLRIARKQYDRRYEIIEEARKNAETVREYQKVIKSKLQDVVNMFPEKTPLNPKITGVIECDGYRIEKIIFESRPNLYVPGNLYIPTWKSGPFPAILKVCGHQQNGKANGNTQRVAISLAKNGFIAFVIDTYAQDERGLISHTQIDIGAMLAGYDIMAYQLWDNLRAIDYLCSRPEVDPGKLGVTGNSGGGTQTMYMAAFEPRIKAAAPCCGLHTRERMFSWNGLADGCHNFADEGKKMLEFADYFISVAPKPILVLAGETDGTFDIVAVSKCVREVKMFYKELGAQDHMDLFTVYNGHGYFKELREAAIWWWKKWLLNDNNIGIVTEPELTLQPEEKLWATKTGSVMKEFLNARSIIDISTQLAKDSENNRKMFWKNTPKQECILKLKELIKYQDKSDKKEIQYARIGDIMEKGITIRKLHLVSRDSFPIPALVYIPEKLKTPLPATIYLDTRGKQFAFNSDSAITNLVKNGRIVIAADLRGFGETTVNLGGLRRSLHVWNDQHQIAQTSIFVGHTLIGHRVQDAIDVLDHLLTYPEVKKSDIELVGTGHYGLVALHAAAIDQRITSVRMIHSIRSWMDIIREPEAKNQFKNVVPGAMKYYDLQDLINSVSPRPVKIIEPVDAFGKII